MSKAKCKSINLHADRKRTLLVVALFLLFSMLTSVLAILTLSGRCAQWLAFLKSGYDYSFVSNDKVKSNSYYQFDAGIVFSQSKDSSKGINSEVLMQCDGEYTSLVIWNAQTRLQANEVAVSTGIARKYHLKEGDKLYSKHIVDSVVVEYVIRELVPEISRSRGAHAAGSSNGLIIMGCDSKYLDNITHASVMFSNENINNLIAEGYDIKDIVYRNDEEIAEVKGLLPYLGLVALMTVCLTVGMAYFLIRGVKRYYLRLISMGFKESELKTAYYRYVGVTGILTIVTSALVMIALFCVFGSIKVGMLVQGMVFVSEVIALCVTIALINRRLWRQ